MARKAPLLRLPNPDHSHHRVLVLGCGVIGLTSALLLQQKGFAVEIWAKDLPPNTTSNKAGAYWYPYSIYPEHKVQKWAKDTYSFYRDFVSRHPRARVERFSCVQFFKEVRSGKNFYDDYVPNTRIATPEEIPPGYVHGEVLETYSVDVDLCLEFFVQQFLANGGRIVRKTVNKIDEAFQFFDFVINCTGLGSRELFNDQSLFAARGQTIVVRGNEHVTVASTHSDEVTYVIPRGGDIVLGGTFQRGNESLLISEADSEEIFERCARLYPQLAKQKVEVLREKVGLRPCRPEVRLEGEHFQGGKKFVIHNYGHGGGGWTVCHGCAVEVAEILEKELKARTSKL